MMIFRRTLMVGILTFTAHSYAEIPVVDDSENFAILHEEQAELERPVSRSRYDLAYNDTEFNAEEPLAVEPVMEEEIINEPAASEETPLAFDNQAAGSHQDSTLLLDKIQDLQQEVQDLRGQLEVQAHDLKLLQEQQLAFYKDLDARLRDAPQNAMQTQPLPIEKKAASLTNAAKLPALSPTAKANPANEQISYLAAYDLVKNKKYDQALTAMQTFLFQYPQSGYTANAQYWLGELYLLKKDYSKAIQHFETVLNDHPTSSKNSASLLKIGYALAASGKKDAARARLREVVKNYPDTHTAQLAAAKLQTL